jgi:hypothetical protein
MGLAECGEHRGQQTSGEPVHGRDRHVAGARALQILDAQLQPLIVLERLPDMGDQQFPDRGEPQAF